jgi:hypothetical protein
MMSLESNGYFLISAPFANESHSYGFASSICHLRSGSVGLLVNDGMYTIFRAPVLCYKSIGIASTLLRMC